MRILFDHGMPAPFQTFLKGHTVKKAKDLGWDPLRKGELLKAAEEATFEVLLTIDKNIRFQQNLTKHAIAIIVLGNSRPLVRRHVERVVAAVNTAKPGNYLELEIPDS